MSERLDGKVAIVTGAGTRLPGIGIGCAIARSWCATVPPW